MPIHICILGRLCAALGCDGNKRFGGSSWWDWRRCLLIGSNAGWHWKKQMRILDLLTLQGKWMQIWSQSISEHGQSRCKEDAVSQRAPKSSSVSAMEIPCLSVSSVPTNVSGRIASRGKEIIYLPSSSLVFLGLFSPVYFLLTVLSPVGTSPSTKTFVLLMASKQDS